MTAGLIIPVLTLWDFRDSKNTWSPWTAVNSFLQTQIAQKIWVSLASLKCFKPASYLPQVFSLGKCTIKIVRLSRLHFIRKTDSPHLTSPQWLYFPTGF